MIVLYNDLYDFFDFNAPDPNGIDSDSEQTEETETVFEDEANDGSVTVNKNGSYIHCLTIIGLIEGHYSSPPNN